MHFLRSTFVALLLLKKKKKKTKAEETMFLYTCTLFHLYVLYSDYRISQSEILPVTEE